MPVNKRVAKDLRQYNLRIKPSDYDTIQRVAGEIDIPMNTLLQKIIAEFIGSEGLNSNEEIILDKIKDLPLIERKAIVKKISKSITDD